MIFVNSRNIDYLYDHDGTLLDVTWLNDDGHENYYRVATRLPSGDVGSYNEKLGTQSSSATVLAYDHRGQMTQDPANVTHLYDAAGNRIRSWGLNDSTVYEYNGKSRLFKVSKFVGSSLTAERHGYRYDLAGWQVMDSTMNANPLKRPMIYNAAGRQRTRDVVTGATQYRQDGLGRLVMRTTSSGERLVFYDGHNIADDLGQQVSFPGSIDETVMTNGCSFITDGNRLIAGVGANCANISPGQVGSIGNSNGFDLIRQEDEVPQAAGSELSFFRNRWYDSRTGRFTQEDPIGFAGGSNLYAYAGNNPATYTDPFGLCPECILDAVFLGADIQDIRHNGLTFRNGLALGVDIAGAAIPFVPALAGVATRAAREAGVAGEAASGIARNIERIPSLSGTAKYRIPDGLSSTTLSEVKNVRRLSYTSQLRDFSAFAKEANLSFDLYVRPDTRMTIPLQEAIGRGDINLRTIR